ncbi:hypothetical protein [Cellulomonas alba]|uniref:Uncharacterized protein n=1 Tax=Cellulomonas alba TaxID=3053467 RepID=A0ABT7SHY4_9CELL|nr:hypothetical protein [Cellulomonas alba]MDM7855804.1 hypothetical protein [Cellulomonas alba]
MTDIIHRARRMAWLEGVPAEWPGDEAYSRLEADRIGFYRLRVGAAARHLRRMLVAPSPEDVIDALSERYFEPKEDWRLFEIAVLLRITAALAVVGLRLNPTRLLVDGQSRPFAAFRISASRDVRVWYQSWPPSTAPSELMDAMLHYELAAGGNRPDIVVEFVDSGVPTRAILLELKASSSSSYLSAGLAQLLGYLRDRPALLQAAASGWLVAPPGSSYVSKSPQGRALWVTSSTAVAEAVRDEALLGASRLK